MSEETKTVKVINGKSMVISFPVAISIITILIGIVAGYFTFYSDIRAQVVANDERVASQKEFFGRELERIYKELDSIKHMLSILVEKR
jgi:hypothetical protein